MAGVRDPAFWKRFSTAVHKREEVVVDPEKNETANAWLERETSKTRRRAWVCPVFWLCIFILVPATTLAVLWLFRSGMLDGLDPQHTAAQQGNPNSDVTGS